MPTPSIHSAIVNPATPDDGTSQEEEEGEEEAEGLPELLKSNDGRRKHVHAKIMTHHSE